MKKLLALTVFFLVAFTGTAQAAGDCSVLQGYIRAAKVWRENGLTREEVPAAIDRTTHRTDAFKQSTSSDRQVWYSLATAIYDGQTFTDEKLEASLGKFCQYPFKLTFDQAARKEPAPQGYSDKTQLCIANSGMFQQIADLRDVDESPQNTLNSVLKTLEIRTTGKYSISEKQVKDAVNLVYFNDRFLQLNSQQIGPAIYDLCIRDFKPKFQPLK
jgi:hypothetical protein